VEKKGGLVVRTGPVSGEVQTATITEANRKVLSDDKIES